MLRSVPLPSSSSSSAILESNDLHRSRSSSRAVSTICSSSRSHAYIPKLEPFSRSKIDRRLKEPSLIQKTENDLADYCSTLEGDASYSCWRAYFELKDLERKLSKEEIEKLLIQSGGIKSLIDCVHGISAINKRKKEDAESRKQSSTEKERKKPFPVPDGLPKSQEELEEEEKGRMPDSPYTRLLRTKGKFPAWYSPAPDHETD
ncbi:PREDICTED: CCG-binding protein 1-like [Nelumbo nucifera]|uniref:CCG-binding protein 1 n=2 Tax=Nelumbo nucifera TaxID=4432 RepID=A0A822Z6T9_NELNU|nr:PREDICTED: CCG-binding protein 1-like [Nelumbo nucifera]DAD40557.1 TPA_asm: hypothetical protein HUJ06_014880 [Nelumbo nucifera]